MTTAQQVAIGIIIFLGLSFAVCLLVGRFFKAGRGPENTSLFDKVEAIKIDQAKKEEDWIVKLERDLPTLRGELARLRDEAPTLESTQERDKLSKLISGGERTLVFLKTRRRDAQESAATIFEGRM